MSDTFVLCPKCGCELDKGKLDAFYKCFQCGFLWTEQQVRIVTTEYFKGEEDEQDKKMED